MRNRNRKGFLLTFVIVALAMMGMVMYVLTDGATSLLSRADAAYLQAIERNLVASGLAWAQAKIAAGSAATAAEPVELSTASFGAPSAKLTVMIVQVQADRATVRIGTSCTKGRRTLDARRDYTIALP